MAEDDSVKFIFIVVYRKLSILLASSRPASSHSFYTGQLMLPTLLFMPPNSSWALVREDCKSCFCECWFCWGFLINTSCCRNRKPKQCLLDPSIEIISQKRMCVLKYISLCGLCLDCSLIILL